MVSDKAFLFSLNNAEGLPPFKMGVNTSRTGNAGINVDGLPWFGSETQADLRLAKTFAYANPGHVYQLPSWYRKSTIAARNLLAGSYLFIPDDIEVFYADSKYWLYQLNTSIFSLKFCENNVFFVFFLNLYFFKHWTFRLLLVVILNNNYAITYSKKQPLNLTNVRNKYPHGFITFVKFKDCFFKYVIYILLLRMTTRSSRNVQFLAFVFLCSCFKKSVNYISLFYICVLFIIILHLHTYRVCPRSHAFFLFAGWSTKTPSLFL